MPEAFASTAKDGAVEVAIDIVVISVDVATSLLLVQSDPQNEFVFFDFCMRSPGTYR